MYSLDSDQIFHSLKSLDSIKTHFPIHHGCYLRLIWETNIKKRDKEKSMKANKGWKHPDVLFLLENIILKNSLSTLLKWANKYRSADFKHLRIPKPKCEELKESTWNRPSQEWSLEFHASQCPCPYVGLSHMDSGAEYVICCGQWDNSNHNTAWNNLVHWGLPSYCSWNEQPAWEQGRVILLEDDRLCGPVTHQRIQ